MSRHVVCHDYRGIPSTQSPNGCCWQAHERGVAIIRKSVMRMRCMQWRSKTCRPCGMESAYVGVEGTHAC